MKLKGFSPLGVEIQHFLFMKSLTYIKRFFPAVPNSISFVREINSPFTPRSRDAVFEGH